MTLFEDYSIYDVSELESVMEPEWPMECRQIKPGKFEYLDSAVDLSGIRIFWPSVNQTIRAKQARLGNGFCFSVPISLSGFVHVDCREINPEDGVLLFPGMELDYLIPQNTRFMTIDVDLSRIPLSLPCRINHPVQLLDKAAKNELLRYCSFVTKSIQHKLSHPIPNQKNHIRHFRNGVVHRLSQVLKAYFTRNPDDTKVNATAEANRLVSKNITEYLSDWNADHPPSISKIAQEFGLSERNLYRHFNQWLGISPYQYYQIEQLHRFHHYLRTDEQRKGAVTRAATKAGIGNYCRAISVYKKHFQESPGETIKKCNRL
ncbi:MAG: helix-turn-helix transcriptional regulator [Verrucomicrobia bacterium]|nr:helix-turn-helix transcriptional regulator [Verrucomicrobiota bacterium]